MNSLNHPSEEQGKRFFPEGVYGILGEKFSRGRSNVEMAQLMAAGGIDILQYREKSDQKSRKKMLEECQEIRKITADAGVVFIVNDFLDIALAVGADGVHQGQDDLPVGVVKKLARGMLVGCSTHTPGQVETAVADGADYIGVGPIFTTQTKADACAAVGLEFLEYVAKNHGIPFVAIGGINRDNLRQVAAKGARTICLVSDILGADDIKHRIHEIKKILGETNG